jgi:hypothetical protein
MGTGALTTVADNVGSYFPFVPPAQDRKANADSRPALAETNHGDCTRICATIDSANTSAWSKRAFRTAGWNGLWGSGEGKLRSYGLQD